MSKIIDQLTPGDFRRSFDPVLFSEWKKSVEAHEKAGLINIILYVIGFVALVLFHKTEPFTGLILFFGLSISGIAIALPKLRKRKEYQRKLGITNNELKEVIKRYNNRIKGGEVEEYTPQFDEYKHETEIYNANNKQYDNIKNNVEEQEAFNAPPQKYSWIQYYFKVLRHYADFSGRARRKEYWSFALFNIVFSFAWAIFMAIVFLIANGGNPSDSVISSYIISLSYMILMLLPGMAVAVRRLHDVGKSAWWLLIVLIPIVGAFWLLVLMLTEGQQEDNQYGKNPKTSPEIFSDQLKLKSAGVALIVTASIFMLAHITKNVIYAVNEFPVSFVFYCSYITNILLLAAGIFLIKEKQIFGMQKNGKNAIALILATFSILFLFNILGVKMGRLIPNLIYIISSLTVILFAASVLFSSHDKNLIRKASVAVIVFMGLQLLWIVYNNMEMSGYSYPYDIRWFQYTNLLSIFNILLPAAFIVLAGTFLSQKKQYVPNFVSAPVNSVNNVQTMKMNPIIEDAIKPHVVLVHKVGSMYHRIDEEQKIIGDYVEIGRDAKCQVRFDDHFETVSRRHAAIIKDDNHWKLLPLTRTNPTFINGTMVQKEWYLQNGDEIQCSINGPKLVFRLANGL